MQKSKLDYFQSVLKIRFCNHSLFLISTCLDKIFLSSMHSFVICPVARIERAEMTDIQSGFKKSRKQAGINKVIRVHIFLPI